ncbi:hypothetical protein [Klebsiella phage vB_KpnM-VAC36]|nr:hypothetical protein [Klebsiella phage vB_KpnM-VAC36]
MGLLRESLFCLEAVFTTPLECGIVLLHQQTGE